MIVQPQKILLASGSPRRAELLKQQGIIFDILPADIDESVLGKESPQDYVRRLAQSKAITSANKIFENNEKYALVLAADTCISIGTKILGKPENLEHFSHMMNMLSGQTHKVFTSVAIAKPETNDQSSEFIKEAVVVQTAVSFDRLSNQKITAYWRSGEPQDKAGGYGIQGLAGEFVTHIEGSYSNVVGLPVFETMQLLARFGVFGLLGKGIEE